MLSASGREVLTLDTRAQPGQSAGRPVWLESFWPLIGVETRYIFALYVWRFCLLVFVILAVVLTLDVASNLRSVISPSESIVQPQGAAKLLFYVSLRAGYNLAGVFPLAMILGIIWTELELATSNERLMILNAGRRVLVSLVPSLYLGIFVGLLQFGAEAYVRPLTVEQQAVNGFRGYGPKFRPGLSKEQWIVLGSTIVNARVGFTPEVSLNNLVMFSLDSDSNLVDIVTAEIATHSGVEDVWTLVNGSVWHVPQITQGNAQDGSMDAITFQRADMDIPISTIWLENIGISPSLLPQSILKDITQADSRVAGVRNYVSAHQGRFASILQQIVVALLNASLCIRWFAPRTSPTSVLKVVGLGVVVYFGFSYLAILGSSGVIPVFAATFAIPTLMIASVVMVADPVGPKFIKSVWDRRRLRTRQI